MGLLALLTLETAQAQKTDKITTSDYARNSICMLMMLDESVTEDMRPILQEAFFSGVWNNKYNNHNIADSLRVLDPAKLTLTDADKAAFNLACQPTDSFLQLIESGEPAPKQKKYNEASTEIFRKIVAEKAKEFNTEGSTIDTVIRLNVARMANKFIEENKVAKHVTSKWILDGNNNYTDALLVERGLLNVTADEVARAKATAAAWNQLVAENVDFQDLFGNTFVVVTRYCYKDKHAVIGDYMIPLYVAAAFDPSGYAGMGLAATEMTVKMATPDGWYVTVDSYLFRLRWNELIGEKFYHMFDENGQFKKDEYDASKVFALEFIGNEKAWVNTKAKESRGLDEAGLVRLAATKATNAALAKFEAKYDQFKTKVPLIVQEGVDKKGKKVNSYAVALGTRDGLSGGEIFDVLEVKAKGKEGNKHTVYNKIGELVVDKKQVWDNEEVGLIEGLNEDEAVQYTKLNPKDKNQVFENHGYLLRMQNKKSKK